MEVFFQAVSPKYLPIRIHGELGVSVLRNEHGLRFEEGRVARLR
jgi:hypothetical protein